MPHGSAAPPRRRTERLSSRHMDARPTEAVILAAGAGERLRCRDEAPPKPLTSVLGKTLLEHSIRTFVGAGVQHCTVVVGFEGATVARAARGLGERYAVQVTTVHNADWERGNGTSVLAASAVVANPFFLAMGDHLFEPAILGALQAQDGGAPLTLAVDHAWDALDHADLDEATKVRLNGSTIVDIGKEIRTFDAVDTGIFLCRPAVFGALEAAQAGGDASLSGAVRVLAARAEAEVGDITGRFWQDVDTPADLARAERRLGALLAEQGSKRAVDGVSLGRRA
ncbi:MAG: NTP transferase domain-containing protein [Dehalococcoidia bacterium]|nr:NTP transferase domain-containing protein [Dehalococcoidia bacterium]